MANTKRKTAPVISHAEIDEYALLDAKIKLLTATRDAIRKRLREAGAAIYCSDRAVINVSFTTRGQLDMDAVRAKLSPQFIAAHTHEVEVCNIRSNVNP